MSTRSCFACIPHLNRSYIQQVESGKLRIMTWLLHPSGWIIIHMSEPLPAKDTSYPVFNVLVMRVPISMKTNNDANSSHIGFYLVPRHLPSFENLMCVRLSCFVFTMSVNKHVHQWRNSSILLKAHWHALVSGFNRISKSHWQPLTYSWING